jgi:hypothetical protein
MRIFRVFDIISIPAAGQPSIHLDVIYQSL